MSSAPNHLDLLRLPLLRPLVRWRYARLLLQLPLLLLALLAMFDGFCGSPLPGLNVATISVWVHQRGLLVLALACVGNVFCAACPLLLMRGPSKWLKRLTRERPWPRALRNKYLVLGLTVAFFFTYEAALLWSSPPLTAGLIAGYFLAILVVDGFFPAGTFCRYVCPLGNFNMLLSGASPTVIAARDPAVCVSCVGKDCVNGRAVALDVVDRPGLQALPLAHPAQVRTFPGCETGLYVPFIQGNRDCTLCLNCLRACPHDNVMLAARSPVSEALRVRPRLDWSLLILIVAWGALLNAFAMTPPFAVLLGWLSGLLHTRAVTLLLVPALLGSLAAGVWLTLGVARWARVSVRDLAPTLLPVTLAVWGSHYLYHFLLGAATLWPAVSHALGRLGLPLPGVPVPALPRTDLAFAWQVIACEVALAATAWSVVWRIRRLNAQGTPARAWPVLLLALGYTSLAVCLFHLPMQVRSGLLF